MAGLFWEKYRWLVADKPKQGDCLKGFQGMKKYIFRNQLGQEAHLNICIQSSDYIVRVSVGWGGGGRGRLGWVGLSRTKE
jgi:hypothetical protein